MEIIGKIVLYIIMACCGIGAAATIIKQDSELAQSFNEGLQAMAAPLSICCLFLFFYCKIDCYPSGEYDKC